MSGWVVNQEVDVGGGPGKPGIQNRASTSLSSLCKLEKAPISQDTWLSFVGKFL